MRMLLCRHGEAVSRAPTDAERTLTKRGIEALQRHWLGLKEDGIGVNMLVASPYVRAQQTAAVIAQVYGLEEWSTCPDLVPDADPQAFLDWLIAQPAQPGQAFISHMPFVSSLTARWTGAGASRFAFDVGGVAHLDVEVAAAEGARLIWLRNPAHSH